MPDHIRRGNAARSKVRARVEHVFAQQKARMGLFIRTIGIKRAEAKITLAEPLAGTSTKKKGSRERPAAKSKEEKATAEKPAKKDT